MGAGETVQALCYFEFLTEKYGVNIRKYHAEKDYFVAWEFQDVISPRGNIYFSGVVANNKNGFADKDIQYVT